MLAARRGHTEAVMALIEAGADVNLQNKASSFVLFISVYSGSIWFIALIHIGLGLRLICQHNFGNNRHRKHFSIFLE